MRWRSSARVVKAVALVRVPILVWTVSMLLVSLGPWKLKGFIGALFDFEGDAFGFFLVAFAASLLSLSIIASVNVVLRRGTSRFGIAMAIPDWLYLAIFVWGMAPTLVTAAVVAAVTPNARFWFVVAGLTGVGLGLVLVFALRVAQYRFAPRIEDQRPRHGLLLGNTEERWLGGIYDEAYCRQPLTNPLSPLIQWFFLIFEPFSAGYFRAKRDGKLYLHHSHAFSLWLYVPSLLIYLILSAYHQWKLNDPSRGIPGFSSLGFVLLFLMLVCWFLSGLTYFFDRYRIPALLIVALMFVVSGSVKEADHVYKVVRRTGPVSLRSPGYVLEHFSASNRIPILIATAGGGIHASAWTTQVLSGLETEFQKAGAEDFRSSVALISGVSGGAVGALHCGLNIDNLEQARKRALESSLDDVAWGWMSPDFWRGVLPWFRNREVDRGWALDHSLQNIEGDAYRKRPTLGSWAAEAGNRLPAFLFNATSADTGAPFVFATTEFPSADASFFSYFHGQFDVGVATAARMSATFPFVSPAARASMIVEPGHLARLVDGGYYDNYGVLTLSQWLDEALKETHPKGVLVIRIRPFPPETESPGVSHGLGFQAIAPLAAFLNVRDSSQQSRADDEFHLFQERWQRNNVEVEEASIRYQRIPGRPQCDHPPNTWELTTEQKDCVAEVWRSPLVQKEVQQAIAKLTGMGAK